MDTVGMKNPDAIIEKQRSARTYTIASAVVVLLIALVQYLYLWYQGYLNILSGTQLLSYYVAILALIFTTFSFVQTHFDNEETNTILIYKIADQLSSVNQKLDALIEESRYRPSSCIEINTKSAELRLDCSGSHRTKRTKSEE